MKKTHIKIIAVVSILTFLAGNLAPLQATTPLRPLTNTTEESAPLLSPDAVFDQKISVLMKISGFPSLSACIIKDDQIIWSKGYGYYDVS
jgi:CubicO group peptidase (beta-lactamase class C family)